MSNTQTTPSGFENVLCNGENQMDQSRQQVTDRHIGVTGYMGQQF